MDTPLAEITFIVSFPTYAALFKAQSLSNTLAKEPPTAVLVPVITVFITNLDHRRLKSSSDVCTVHMSSRILCMLGIYLPPPGVMLPRAK